MSRNLLWIEYKNLVPVQSRTLSWPRVSSADLILAISEFESDLIASEFVSNIFDNVIENLTVTTNPLTNNRIVVDGSEFKELIRSGFEHNTETNRMEVPFDSRLVEFNANSRPIEQLSNYRDLLSLYGSAQLYGITDGIFRVSSAFNLSGSTVNQFKKWMVAQTEYLDNIDDIQGIIFQDDPVDFNIGGSMRGILNCFVNEVCSQTTNKYIILSEKYQIMYQHLIESFISESVKRVIKVHTPFKTLTFGEKYRKNKKKIINLYYNNNHVVSELTSYADLKVIKMELGELTKTFKQFDVTQIQQVFQSKTILYGFQTYDSLYKLSSETDGYMKGDYFEETLNVELSDDDFSATAKYRKLFLQDNELLDPIPQHHDNIEAIRSILHHGLNSQMSYPDQEACVIDLKKAYTNYEKYDSYTGFPSNLGNHVKSLSQAEFLIIIKKYEGFGLTTFKNIYTGEETKCWRSFPFIRNRLSFNESIIIHECMIAQNRIHLDTSCFGNDEVKSNKRLFHKVIGSLTKIKKTLSFATSDPILAKSYISYETIPGLYICSEEVSYINSYFYPHISQYIYTYCEIELENMYRQLINKKMQVHRIWIDGITINKSELSSISIPNNFHIKRSHLTNFEGAKFSMEISYPEPHNLNNYSLKFNGIMLNLNNRRLVITGSAGTGKTYLLNQLHDQMSNCKILLPKHDLKSKFPGRDAQTIHSYTLRHIFNNDILLFDEVFMNCMKHMSVCYDNSRYTICAGHDKQLSNQFTSTPYTIHDHEKKESSFVVNLTYIWRQSDVTFINNLNKTANNGTLSYIKKRITVSSAIKKSMLILSSTHKEIDRINKIGLKKLKTKSVKVGKYEIKVGAPIRFYSSKYPDYYSGMMGTILGITERKCLIKTDRDTTVNIPITYFCGKIETSEEVPIPRTTTTPKIKIAYSITYHGVQGSEFENIGIVLNMNNLFTERNQMKYVGASRAKKLEQLYILRN